MTFRSTMSKFLGISVLSLLAVSSAGASPRAASAPTVDEWEAGFCDDEPQPNPCVTFDHDGAQVIFHNETGFFIKAVAVRKNDQGQVVDHGKVLPGGGEVADVQAGAEAAWDFSGGSSEPGLHFAVRRVM